METNHYSPLTASEISILWGFYLKNSLSVCVMTYFLEKVEEADIRYVLQLVKDQGQQDLAMIEDVCSREQMAIPVGFTDKDMNPTAPRLFNDAFMLEYARQLQVATIAAAGAAIPVVTRSDITTICKTVLHLATKNHDIAKDTLIAKGQYSRPPVIPVPKQVDFVKKQNFFRGFLGEKRPLSSAEITHLFMNMQTNALGKALMMGFAQVAKDAQVTKYLVRSKEIAHKHVEIFRSHLAEEDLPGSRTWDDHVMSSNNESPFSDKLMTFHTTALVDIGLGNYGLSTAGSPRHDLGLMYARLMAEVAAMAQDGGNLMISNAWLEQPPPAPDRKALEKGRGG